MSLWNRYFKSLLGIFLKSACPLCRRPAAEELCPYCQRQVQNCQLTNASHLWQGELPVFAWGKYSGSLKRAIAALKYENQPQLAQPLGLWLGQAWLNSRMAKSYPQLVVVPIPMHPAKQKQRGFNQAELLAESFCQMTRLPLQKQGLARVKATQAQFSLSATQRATNLAEAFSLGKDFQRRLPASPVLLLDDIYTTGATARSAVQVLQQQGIKVYGLVAIATPKVYDRE